MKNDLTQVLCDLKECGKTLTTIADNLTQLLTEDSAAPVDPTPAEPEITFLDVRKVFVEKARAGHTDALKALLESYGADKLSSVEPSLYPALLYDVEAIV